MEAQPTPSQFNEFASWRGTWSALSTYDKGEAVFHEGSSYICLQFDVTGTEPGTDEDVWNLLAQGGDAGEAAAHPDLSTHDSLGLATDAELTTHAADTTSVHGITDTSALETTTGSAAKVTAHEALGDPHTGYVQEAATPGGELGGTYATPTVDATHSGSSHASIQAAAEATAAADVDADIDTHEGLADPHTVHPVAKSRLTITIANGGNAETHVVTVYAR